jgi:TRAP-type mannitol/chloroaromatic compound transport system substrate-binding protein
VLQTENKQLVEEKKIEAVKLSKLEKEMREKLLKRVGIIYKNFNAKNMIFKKLQESQDELAEKKFRSLEEENYVKEIAELKVFLKKLYTINSWPIFIIR